MCRISEQPYNLGILLFYNFYGLINTISSIDMVIYHQGEIIDIMQNLGKVVYSLGDERCKSRALLCSVFHRSIFDDFYAARDLLIMSNLKDIITRIDIDTQ